MQPLPREFLIEMARKYNLSEGQGNAFVELFSSNSNANQQKVAESLNISDGAFRTRMTGVYQKFSLNQKTPNKARLLYDLLFKEYQKVIPENNQNTHSNGDINTRVNKLRDQVKADIETRCGTMRIFDMTQPIGLSDIYTQVNILKKISGRSGKGSAELFKDISLEDFDRACLGKVTQEKIPGKKAVAKYRKLLILGKPGAGKTTFLRHLAIQCNRGEFQGDLVPFFVTLKDFAEAKSKPDLLTYLDFSNATLKNERETLEHIFHIFHKGKALILLDGLDEVLEAYSERVLKEIRDFSTRFPDNQYVMTCRIAAKEYTFEQFTEVEIADFDWQQITTFATNWFKNKAIKAETFLARLEKDKPIQELASNPLLLTLLCLAFEESGDFPGNRAGLYKEGLDALLKKWDAKRGIKRDEVYKKLWVQRKEDLLSKIAWDTFAPGEYFFKQDKAERYIGEYIRNLPGTSDDEDALRLDSEVVLRSIESQHGLLVARAKNIYSFSHLTFQEYFTAREIIDVRQSSDESLQELVNHIFEKRWREVFLLAVAMSSDAGKLVLLMKKKIDGLIAEDEKLQQFLQWLNEKTKAVDIQFRLEDVPKIQASNDFYVNINLSLSRTLYLDLYLYLYLDLYLDLYLYLDLSRTLDLDLSRTLYFDLYRTLDLDLSRTLDLDLSRTLDLDLDLSRTLDLAKKCNGKLYQELQTLRAQLPDEENQAEFKQWWQTNRKAWTEDLRAIMIKYRNIGHDWQFNNEQQKLLEQYCRANQLLTQCLHQECYVSREVRQEIEETLLLPMSEINQGKGLATS
jgi:predicted NACHT family NTPase